MLNLKSLAAVWLLYLTIIFTISLAVISLSLITYCLGYVLLVVVSVLFVQLLADKVISLDKAIVLLPSIMLVPVPISAFVA